MLTMSAEGLVAKQQVRIIIMENKDATMKPDKKPLTFFMEQSAIHDPA